MADTKASFFAHSHALVETTDVGAGTTIWAFAHVLPGARIGTHCNICDHCFIENGVVIGDNVTLKCGIYLWKGVTIEDNVFLGPNVVFTNDLRPRSKNANFSLAPTLIKQGASIGANSTVLAGVTVGRYAMSGIGAVITRNVPDYALVYGNPAKQRGWVDEEGTKLEAAGEGQWVSPASGKTYAEGPTGLQPVA